MRNLKANLALALGYWLVYCGVARGGAYATAPWTALADAGGQVTA